MICVWRNSGVFDMNVWIWCVKSGISLKHLILQEITATSSYPSGCTLTSGVTLLCLPNVQTVEAQGSVFSIHCHCLEELGLQAWKTSFVPMASKFIASSLDLSLNFRLGSQPGRPNLTHLHPNLWFSISNPLPTVLSILVKRTQPRILQSCPLSSCPTSNPWINPDSRHHRPDPPRSSRSGAWMVAKPPGWSSSTCFRPHPLPPAYWMQPLFCSDPQEELPSLWEESWRPRNSLARCHLAPALPAPCSQHCSQVARLPEIISFRISDKLALCLQSCLHRCHRFPEVLAKHFIQKSRCPPLPPPCPPLCLTDSKKLTTVGHSERCIYLLFYFLSPMTRLQLWEGQSLDSAFITVPLPVAGLHRLWVSLDNLSF